MLTAIVERAVAGDRREDERAVGRLVGGVDPDPGGRGVGGDRGVDGGVAGGRDDEAHAVEVGGLVRPLAQLGDRRPGPARRRHVGRDDAHRARRRGQTGDLAGGDRPGADDEHRDVLEVEEHGVTGTPHRANSRTKLMNYVGI